MFGHAICDNVSWLFDNALQLRRKTVANWLTDFDHTLRLKWTSTSKSNLIKKFSNKPVTPHNHLIPSPLSVQEGKPWKFTAKAERPKHNGKCFKISIKLKSIKSTLRTHTPPNQWPKRRKREKMGAPKPPTRSSNLNYIRNGRSNRHRD